MNYRSYSNRRRAMERRIHIIFNLLSLFIVFTAGVAIYKYNNATTIGEVPQIKNADSYDLVSNEQDMSPMFINAKINTDFESVKESLAEDNLLFEVSDSIVQYSVENVLTLPNAINDASKVQEPEETIYTVQVGDSLWSIAEKFYGDGYMYSYVRDTNNLSGNSILPGQELIIKTIDSDEDKREYLQESYVEIKSAEETKKKSVSYSSSSSSAKNKNVPENMEYIGDYFITGYDPWCSHCCGKSNGITASGAKATVGRTIAMSKNFPFGTRIYIEGYGIYTVEDRGVGAGVIDVAADSHEACYGLTAYNVPCYIVK